MQLELPIPNDKSTHHSLQLIQYIKNKIKSSSPSITHQQLSFAQYMHDCLYTPKLGYYTGGLDKIGTTGDFTTAPEHSEIFSYTLAQQISQIISNIKNPVILELGAGSGKMATNILQELSKLNTLPLEYWILEPSIDLQDKQYKLIKKHHPNLIHKTKWLSTTPTKKFNGIIIGNEVIDAMPVHALEINPNGVFELGVNLDTNTQKFNWCQLDKPNQTLINYIYNNKYLKNIAESITNSKQENIPQTNTNIFSSQVNLALEPWLKDISKNLAQGAIIFLDYGDNEKHYYAADKNQGSIRCFYQHRIHDDPFVYPGLQDITADVNFTQLATAAYNIGLQINGYTNQAMFLHSCNIDQVIQNQYPNPSPADKIKISNQTKLILSPLEMGDRIKVLTLSKDLSSELTQNLLGYRLSNNIKYL